MFSCNGIGMVAHQDRLSIMREVHRLLKPGGVFLFSTHNQNCPDHSAGFRLPEFEFTRNPKLLESVPPYVVEEVLQKLALIFGW